MPTDLHGAWRAVNDMRAGQPSDSAASHLANWLLDSGPALGFRPPHAEERARALDLAHYFRSLGLPEVEAFSAQ
eukprot:5843530-Prorocentrum_lima.AAC.1